MSSRSLAFALSAFLTWSIAHSRAEAQTTLYVNDLGNPGSGCTNWVDACPNLQTALGLANFGDQIWVAAGTYRPASANGDRNSTFQLLDGVGLYGGFAGTETTLEDRAGLFDQTILSGDLNDNDQPGFVNSGENSCHVVTGSNTGPTALLDGFVISAGNAKTCTNKAGGGLLSLSGSPTIRQCSFTANQAKLASGGGMYNSGGGASISACTFTGNSGGGMQNVDAADITVGGCTFSGNTAGSGMINGLSTVTVTNCVFAGNSAQWGAGMLNALGSVTVRNCLFAGNTASMDGGGVGNFSGNAAVVNCTFAGNSGDGAGGGMFNSSSPYQLMITNCIFWNNADDADGTEGGPFTDESAQLVVPVGSVSYSLIQGLDQFRSSGNIGSDPLFADADGDDDDPATLGDNDYRLGDGSPAIDAGNNSATACLMVDLEGRDRRVDDPATPDTGLGEAPLVDLGVYEFAAAPAGPFADCNHNALEDACEYAAGRVTDCNNNLLPDTCDLATGASADELPAGGDAIPDECQTDCNANRIPDLADIASGSSPDCNYNSLPDECDLAKGASQDVIGPDGVPDECQSDCNENLVPDEVDIATGTSSDCTDNGIPDECEPDCNRNGTADSCDIAACSAEPACDDCNANGVPDACDVDSGAVEDSDGDGVLNPCEACPGFDDNTDTDGDGIADGCDADTVWYVDDDARGANDGSSWADAFMELQSALQAAQPGDQLWVATGVYKPDHDVDSGVHTLDPEATFLLKASISLFGGFDGTEQDLNARAALFDLTNLSGDLAGNDGPGFANNDENSFSVVTTAGGVPPTAVLDGFRISGGNSPGAGGGLFALGDPTIRNCSIEDNAADYRGGGAYFNGSPKLSACVFAGNQAVTGGGGAYGCGDLSFTECVFTNNERGGLGVEGAATLVGCEFEGNSTQGQGGAVNISNGIFCGGPVPGNLSMTECTLHGNIAAEDGGGLYVWGVNTVLTGCTFIGNMSQDQGGGLYHTGLSQGDNIIITSCLFEGNQAPQQHGGGAYLSSTYTIEDCVFIDNMAEFGGGLSLGEAGTMTNCTFWGNTAMGGYGGGASINYGTAEIRRCSFFENNSVAAFGGGVWLYPSGDITVSDSQFVGNSAEVRGGGVYGYGNSTLVNCTIYGNSAGESGSGVYAAFSAISISNSIVWGNTIGGTATVSFSNVQGGYPGSANINADPGFVDPVGPDGQAYTADDDLRLLPSSPCVDAAGNQLVADGVSVDLDGYPRFVDDPASTDCPQAPGTCGASPVVDMGAFEFQLCVTDIDEDGTVGAADLGLLLGAWGPNPGHPADFNADGVINAADLALLLGAWGPCAY